MRRAYHVARADFLQRVRSRRLLVVLAVVAYLGYLVNVGQIELAYQVESGGTVTNVHGIDTAAFIGLKAGMTGSAVLLFGGFYLMKNTLERDRVNDVDQLVASTPVTDRTYLVGKWMSNVGLGSVVLVALGFATVVNHAVHGVGSTRLVPLLGPIVALALPVCALVGAAALLFETVDVLDGTGGNVVYFLLATFALAGLASAEGTLPGELPPWVRASDVLGHLTVYALTADAVIAEVPEFGGVLPSFGLLDGDEAFRYDGGNWPTWIYVQRAALVLPAIVTVLGAAIPFDRVRSDSETDEAGWRSRLTGLLPSLADSDATVNSTGESRPVDSVSLTPVEERDTGGFCRLVAAELRLTLRGRRWWWYAGAVLLIAVPLTGFTAGGAGVRAGFVRQLVLPLAFVWPIFLWSELGVRTTEHGVTDFVLSSRYPLAQLVAEWLSGVVVAAGISAGVVTLFVATGQTSAVLGIAGGVLFAPSLALAAGIWSRSSWLFEVSYLMIWYVGPLNGAVPVDFVGTTVDSIEAHVPVAFVGLGFGLFTAALVRRKSGID